MGIKYKATLSSTLKCPASKEKSAQFSDEVEVLTPAGEMEATQSRGGGADGAYADMDLTQPYESVQGLRNPSNNGTTPPEATPGRHASPTSYTSGGDYGAALEVTQKTEAMTGSPGLKPYSRLVDHQRGSMVHVPPSTPTTSYPSTSTPAPPRSRLATATNSSSLPPGTSPLHAPNFGPSSGETRDQKHTGIDSPSARSAEAADRGEPRAKDQSWMALVPQFLEEDTASFASFIASHPQHTASDKVRPLHSE